MKEHTPSLLRKLAAAIYDLFLLFGILILAGMLAVLVNRGQIISANNHWFKIYLLTWIVAFYHWFWAHGGQTLGMKAWRLKLINQASGSWKIWQTLLRITGGLAGFVMGGLGWLWMLWDPKRRSWADIFSQSKLIVIEKHAK